MHRRQPRIEIVESRLDRRLLWTAVGLCLGLGALLGWRPIASPDIGFHLSSARWILEHRAWPATDPFTFTFSDRPYYDLQWLFQLLVYAANHAGGTALMLALKIAVTSGFWGLLLARAWRRAGALPWSAPLLLMLVALADYYEERPQMFSWVYGSLVLLVLDEFASGNRRWLAALPVILLLWVNTHSLFVLGLVIIGVHVVWELRKGAGADRRLLLWAGLALAACVVNPYGVNGLLFPLTQFGEIQPGQAFSLPSSGIAEFQSPFSTAYYFVAGRFVLFQAALYWHLYSLLALAGAIAARKHARVPDVVLWVLFGYIFWQAHKNFGYFVMVTFPLAAAGLDHVASSLSWRGRRRRSGLAPATPPVWRSVLAWSGIVVGLVMIALAATGRLYRLEWNPHRIGAGYNSEFLPVDASRFLNDHRIQGRVMTTFGYGGYVNWATRLPVNIYGVTEIVGPESYAEYVASLTPAGLPRYISRWKPTVAVVSFRDAPYWVFHLNAQPDWRLVHFTDTAAVFLQDSVTGPARLPAPKPDVDYATFSREQMRQAIVDSSTRPDMTFGAWLQGSGAFPQSRIRLSTFYLHTGQFAACAHTGVDGLRTSPIRIPELLLILGHAFNGLGDYELSDLCFAAVLQSPTDFETRQQIENAKRARTRR